ncbi:MAG TPA: hypothetical protein VK633_00860, partial [Verrucomicrobiae bacterium]|nr:hypothetical protein [Verrucomicrobiae bacterium]
MRVESLEAVHRYAKSGIMVRESLASTARMVSLFATPTGPTELPAEDRTGEDQVEFNFRRGTGDGANNINLGSPGFPNAWLRLARRGSIVYGLVSRDGSNWTSAASVDTSTWPAGALKPNVLLGLGASSHEDTRLVHTELRDFTPVTAVGQLRIVGQPTNSIGVVGSNARFSVQLNDPVDATYQWYVGTTLIPGATNSSYITSTLSEQQNKALYSVRVNGPGGNLTSAEAPLSVVTIEPPASPDLFFDFDDGEVPFGTEVYGTAEVDPSGGLGGSAGLILTRAANNQNGAFIIQDFNGGAAVNSFNLAFKLKIGPGSAKPADGFSVSFGTNIPAAVFSAPQQGIGPGLAISFDFYDNGEFEAPAIDVFYGVDPASLPLNLTGNILHRSVALSDLVTSRYVEVIIRMNPDGKLDLLFDGDVIAYQLQTPFVPVLAGRFGFGAYAGGQNALQSIDDVRIATTTLGSDAYVSSISPLGNNVSAQPDIIVGLVDQSTAFDRNAFTLQVNESSVVPEIINDPDVGATTLKYSVPSLLAAGSTNRITLIWTDTAGTQRTNSSSFRVGSYVTLPATSALPAGSGNSQDSGFAVRLYQVNTNIVASSSYAESILAGERGGNVADLTIANEEGVFVDPSATTTIDYDVNAAPVGLSTFPGIPGLTDSKENFAAEVKTYIEFAQPGFYQMAVRSDDGFVLTAGDENAPVILGSFSGERE